MSLIPYVGLYVWDDAPDQHPFWKACGINTLQFCDLGWHRNAHTVLNAYHQQKVQEIRSAHRDGFKVYVILFANIEQWKGPQDLEPSGIGVKFHPSNAVKMRERLDYLRQAIRTMREADGFTFFAGDPGGVPEELGPATAQDWIDMAKRVEEIVAEEAPHAVFHFNPWAITMWQYPQLPCEGAEWWLRETQLTKEVVDAILASDKKFGIEFPCHNYYRALALREYRKAGLFPPVYPMENDLQKLKQHETPHIWAWPYFLLDEADDGDVGPDGSITPLPQCETRYIYRFVKEMRTIGMPGIIGNWSYVGHKAKALNTYAFGRFCNDPLATPETVIEEYAHCIADDDTWPQLAQIFRFIENHSNWQRKLPDDRRLPDFVCDITNREDAEHRLQQVRLRPAPRPFGLACDPEEYLELIRRRLLQMKAR